jgi:ABC-type Na+ efflux pump permease subunit
MAKSKKSKSRDTTASRRAPAGPEGTAEENQAGPWSPPRRKPALLAVSIVLFLVWFIFLLVVAVGGLT